VLGGLVDPRLLGQVWRPRPAAEPLRVLCVGAVEGRLESCADVGCGAEVDRRRGVHADPGVAVLVVVGGEEPIAERTCVGE
jgi:hypothetical protein